MNIAKFFDGVFDDNAPALLMYGKRVEIIAGNLANADTPGYKARDLDFATIMAELHAPPMPLTNTDAMHISLTTQAPELKYRVPYQASLDGNTVETTVEQAQFAENSVRYQFELDGVNGTIKDILFALTGKSGT